MYFFSICAGLVVILNKVKVCIFLLNVMISFFVDNYS
jgi:hypothetical protein